MLKFLLNIIIYSFSLFQLVNSQTGNHNCTITDGYTWCESSKTCIRKQETDCIDVLSCKLDSIPCNWDHVCPQVTEITR